MMNANAIVGEKRL